jgi:sugar/nucleoside kinase (ribokinase family)
MSSLPQPAILCVGSVLWDIIGHAVVPMGPGDDVPGRVRRVPGGVALNIAAALARIGAASGVRPVLLSAVGRDPAGDALVAACAALGLDTGHLTRDHGQPTDTYLAIEHPGGLVAAVADAHGLEAAGDRILAPLVTGPFGTAARPWAGTVVLDGNLTADLLARIATLPALAAADLRVAPASPGKADRLRPLLGHPRVTLYVNRAEAACLCGHDTPDAAAAAQALVARGARRVVVTDGSGACADAGPHGLVTALPPPVRVVRVTGAGDTFMAAHLLADLAGAAPADALTAALAAAAAHISGDPA